MSFYSVILLLPLPIRFSFCLARLLHRMEIHYCIQPESLPMPITFTIIIRFSSGCSLINVITVYRPVFSYCISPWKFPHLITWPRPLYPVRITPSLSLSVCFYSLMNRIANILLWNIRFSYLILGYIDKMGWPVGYKRRINASQKKEDLLKKEDNFRTIYKWREMGRELKFLLFRFGQALTRFGLKLRSLQDYSTWCVWMIRKSSFDSVWYDLALLCVCNGTHWWSAVIVCTVRTKLFLLTDIFSPSSIFFCLLVVYFTIPSFAFCYSFICYFFKF